MGCFSFICTGCGKPINSTSLRGENVRLSLLEDGKVIEEMQGEYDSYGRVFDKNGKSVEWESKDWDDIVPLMYSNNYKDGICATHVACIGEGYQPIRRSKDDPAQGWGRLDKRHCSECGTYHIINE